MEPEFDQVLVGFGLWGLNWVRRALIVRAVGDVVLDYCTAVRGILNDSQGGPLTPPGLRMAGALGEVHESLQRNLDAKKGAHRRRA